MSEVRLLYGKIARHAHRHTNHKPVKTFLTLLSQIAFVSRFDFSNWLKA